MHTHAATHAATHDHSPQYDINSIMDINEIKRILFKDIHELIISENQEYQTLIPIWCIISFATVINECIEYNNWINFTLYG